MVRFGRLIAWFAMLVGLVAAVPGYAAEIGATCHAFSGETTTYRELDARPSAWICSRTHWKDSHPAGWLRFDAKDWEGREVPKTFITRVTKFEQMSLFAVQPDGNAIRYDYGPADVTPRAGRSIFSIDLPQIPEETNTILVRFDRAWNAAVLSDAQLSDDPLGGAWPVNVLVGFGILLGILFAPVIFDFAIYSVMRQRFVLWHGALVLAMLAYVLTFSGVISVFFDLGVTRIASFNGLAPAIAVFMAGFFVADFLEPGALSQGMRRALRIVSVVSLVGPGAITLHLPPLDYTSHQFFFLGFIPALVVNFAAMAQAYRRNSRSVKFLMAAWLPVMLCGLERIVRGLGFYSAPPLVDEMLYIALVVEVVISALGVADRMISLRHQRDIARTESRMLEDLAERDPLTDLLNRRAIEPRFEDLCNAGFNTFALIDLDDFKSVNDEYGHAVGDEVLKAVAIALAPDDDTLVMRLGGEEFLMLLRGEQGAARAEQRRQALPRRIADNVPGITRLVTASMGLIEGPAETMGSSAFRSVYARADKLLYEAKQAGRDRMIAEKLTLFASGVERRAGERREADRRSICA